MKYHNSAICVRVSDELREKLEGCARKQKVHLSALIRILAEKYVKNIDKKINH